jgi:hypothetical protein
MRNLFSWDVLVLMAPFAAMSLSAIAIYLWPRAQRFILWSWVFLGLGFILFTVYSPMLSMLAWHVQNGNHVIFQDKRFYVPMGWSAKPLGTGITIERQSYFPISEILNGSGLEVVDISPKRRAEAPIDEQQAAERKIARILYGQSDVPEMHDLIKSASGDITCLYYRPRSEKYMATAHCWFVQSGWTAGFFGSRNGLDTFFEIVRTSDSP